MHAAWDLLQIEEAAHYLEGTCFNNMPANRQANGWVRLLSNSAKLSIFWAVMDINQHLPLENALRQHWGIQVKELKCHAG